MNSLHLPQADGKSHAVDLVWLDGDVFNFQNQEAWEYLAHKGMEVAKNIGFPLRNLGIDLGYDWYHFERRRGQ